MGTKNDLWSKATLLLYHIYTFIFMGSKNKSTDFISNKVVGKKVGCVSVR